MSKKYSVLMALMIMEIGGAETHVLELSKALKKMGIDVSVVSNGGVYVKELEESGIKHFKLPLHNKQPGNLLRSYFGLKKIIRENGITVVHAHARIPAFLCGILYKRMKFHFITSAHWVFNTEFPFNILTNWGERTVAVSKDIKKYLTDNYRIKEKNIVTTVNGIDTQKFDGTADYSGLIEELALDPKRKRIVYVSRLDKNCSLVGHRLVESAPGIFKKYKDFELIIVGGGNDFENIQKKAGQVNRLAGRKLIHMTGPRIDINRFMALADFFVGVSRAALEAMAAGKPTVLAGAEGYYGIFEEGKEKVSIDTNLCFRGCGETRAEKLTADCLTMLQKSEAEMKHLGEFGRDFVKEFYSVERMAADTRAAYEEVLKTPVRKIDVVISGYYGSRNSGDDALLKSIVDSLKAEKPDINIVALSRRPRETQEDFRVSAVYWLNVFSIIHTLKNSRLLILGGGNLMQDSTSTRTVVYYLMVIRAAKHFGAKVMLYANGIGPLKKDKNRLLVKTYLNKIADYITLREESSVEELENIGVTLPPVRVTADAAFLLPKQTGRLTEASLNNKAYFVVSVRGWKKIDPAFEDKIADICDYIKDRYKLQAVFVSMQDRYDSKISKSVCSKMKQGGMLLDKKYSLNEMLSIVQNAKLVLGMRLHTIIYAASAGIPVVGLAYEPKVRSMLNYMGQEFICDVSNINCDTIKGQVDIIMEKYMEISGQLAAASEILREKAKVNTEIAMEFL